MSLFKKKQPEKGYDPRDLKKIHKKRRKNALRLLEEYNKGIIIRVDANYNQKERINEIKRRELDGEVSGQV